LKKIMILSLSKDMISIRKEQDVILFRNRVKEFATRIKMGLVNQTKLITAASELVRNMLKYADGGDITIEVVTKGRDNGIRIVFRDEGPGIADIKLAMRDGYSTARSLGLGLPGAKRLVNDFTITSELNKGTIVTIIKWANG
jgi:serine/threonine-protein kinase RsbT